MDSIRDAVFTVSPNRQYLGIFWPTTPAQTGPTKQSSQIKWTLGRHFIYHENACNAIKKKVIRQSCIYQIFSFLNKLIPAYINFKKYIFFYFYTMIFFLRKKIKSCKQNVNQWIQSSMMLYAVTYVNEAIWKKSYQYD